MTIDGVPASALAARWGVPQCGVFRQLPSALDAIHEIAAQGAPPGSVVIAEEQTAGRGRDGRTWRSPAGGAWVAILFRPPALEAGAIAIRAGLAVAEAADRVLGRSLAAVKWPNDVLLGNQKVAGVLCEARWQGDRPQWVAVGVGVNVVNEVPAELADRATALKEFAPAVTRLALLDRLIPALAALAAAAPRLSDAECQAFGRKDWLKGRQIVSPIAGRAQGIAPDGALLVDSGAGTTRVREGHVALA